MTSYNLHLLPSLQRFGELLAEKRIGRVLSVRAEVGPYLPSWRRDLDYKHSISALVAFLGGELLELRHEVYYLRWLLGEVGEFDLIQTERP